MQTDCQWKCDGTGGVVVQDLTAVGVQGVVVGGGEGVQLSRQGWRRKRSSERVCGQRLERGGCSRDRATVVQG
jgi:hypothetical protein